MKKKYITPETKSRFLIIETYILAGSDNIKNEGDDMNIDEDYAKPSSKLLEEEHWEF